MSPDTIKFIITAVLFLHGVAHAWAAFQLLPQATNPNAKPELPIRSWLFPRLSPRPAAIVAGIYWLLSGLGFIAAALSFWNAPATGFWRQLAVGSALISTIGIALFWIILNMGMNLAIQPEKQVRGPVGPEPPPPADTKPAE